MPTQDGVTADEVAEVQGRHEVCEELRKHMRGGRRPLSKVSPVLWCSRNFIQTLNTGKTLFLQTK